MFETVITSSVLIVIILLIRRAFKERISNTLRYALWLLVAVRLLLPVSLVKSPVSVLNLIASPKSQSAATIVPADTAIDPVALSTPDIDGIIASDEASTPITPVTPITPAAPATPTAPITPITPTITEAHENIKPEVPNTSQSQAQSQAPQVTPQKAVKPSPLTIAKIVWLSVIGVMILWYVIANTAFYINLRRKRQELDCPCKLKVYTVAGLKSPCLFGLIKPAVYVTEEAALDAQTLDCIIAHELCHYRHGDMIWATLRYFLLAVYWFNPFVWAAAFVSKKDCEYACDEAAIKRLGEERRFDYGKALVAMVPKNGNSTSIFGLASTTMSANGRTLKSRVEFIAKKPKTTVVATVMAVMIALFSVGCTFTAAQGGEPSRDVPENTDIGDPINADPNQGDSENMSPENVSPENTSPENTPPESESPENETPENTLPESISPENISYENKSPEDTIDENTYIVAENLQRTVYWQAGDPIDQLAAGHVNELFFVDDQMYFSENGKAVPLTQIQQEISFTDVYGLDCRVVYSAFVDDKGEVKKDYVYSPDYIVSSSGPRNFTKVSKYGSRLYFTNFTMLYCYDFETGKVTTPLSSAPFGFVLEDYEKMENPEQTSIHLICWFGYNYSSSWIHGDKLFYYSNKSVSPDGSRPAYEWGIWSYDMATGEEKRLYNFGNFLPNALQLLDENTIIAAILSDKGAIEYNYYIVDMSSGVNDKSIKLSKTAEKAFGIGKGVKDVINRPLRYYSYISTSGKELLICDCDGSKITLTEVFSHKEHIFNVNDYVVPFSSTKEHNGILAFDHYDGIYILNLNNDTATLIKNRPGERQSLLDLTDDEIRVFIYDSETNERLRYEGIRFDLN